MLLDVFFISELDPIPDAHLHLCLDMWRVWRFWAHGLGSSEILRALGSLEAVAKQVRSFACRNRVGSGILLIGIHAAHWVGALQDILSDIMSSRGKAPKEVPRFIVGDWNIDVLLSYAGDPFPSALREIVESRRR